ncbi:MAG: TetR family transcriptional regulator [Alphaproteobacteria bacterium]
MTARSTPRPSGGNGAKAPGRPPMPGEVPDPVLDAALKLIAREGWRRLSLGQIARDADIPLAELYRYIRGKPALLSAFSRRIDLEVLAHADEIDLHGTPRDRVFDVLMLRFEALEPYRDVVRVLRRELRRDPVALMTLARAGRRAFSWSMEAAGLPSGGVSGAAQSRLLGYVFLRVLDVWLEDDPADLAHTMAALDRRLRRVERFLGGSAEEAGPPEADGPEEEPDAARSAGTA